MSVCLVTGGAGFIGAHVVNSLVDNGHSVVVLDDLSGGFRENVNRNAQFNQGCITDVALVDRLFSENAFDSVFHLAAYAAEGLSHFIRCFNYRNNLIGSTNLINAAVKHGTKCFVFTSSIAVYGAAQLPMTESTIPRPEDPYGIAKFAVEMDLQAAHKMFGLNYVVFRPHNVYGEFQNIGDRYRNVVGIFMNQLMEGKPLTIFGDGSQSRAFSYVADVAPIIARSPEVEAARNQVFNIGADESCTVTKLAAAVQAAMNIDGKTLHLDARNEVQHAYSDHSRLQDVFGVSASTPLADGLERMAAWAKNAGARETSEFTQIEVSKNLPDSWKGLDGRSS